MRIPNGLRAAAGNLGAFDFLDPANIGLSVEGGYFGGLISHTANGVATHALIVAPSASGASGTNYTLTTNYAWKTTDTSTSGTTSSYDGKANTDAMVTAGIANHPAANFCDGLTINGYSDWYLPARYELDIIYYNLKPTTASNNTGWGINDYSVPKRTSNYTSGTPAQTSVAAFQSTGSEAFDAAYHWSSTQASSTNAWRLFFGSGFQANDLKSDGYPVRAIRRVTL